MKTVAEIDALFVPPWERANRKFWEWDGAMSWVPSADANELLRTWLADLGQCNDEVFVCRVREFHRDGKHLRQNFVQERIRLEMDMRLLLKDAGAKL